ncbi:MAG: GNAT family N-acetyltransferase [Thermoplasmata archaeon]
MNGLEIRELCMENLEDFIELCIPPEKKNDPFFVEGIRAKKRWVHLVMEKYGSAGMIAYLNSRPAGMLQYLPNPEKKIVEIECIFVPEKENCRKGIGKALLKAFLEKIQNCREWFWDERPGGVITYAFSVPGRYPQYEFYKKMGFRQVSPDDPFLLYFPLAEKFVYTPEKYKPLEEDRNIALVFYNPGCPFSIYFARKIRELLVEVAPDLPIRMINQFEEREEVKKRGSVSFCIVNKKPIETFFMDRENFQREVREALGQQ